MSAMRRPWELLLGAAVGAGAGALWPLPQEEASVVTPAEPPAAELPPSDPPPPELRAFADPCAAVRAVERRADELAHELEDLRERFARRYGEPASPPPGFDRAESERRLGADLASDRRNLWSTVDCSLHPCVGLLLVDATRHPDDLTARPGPEAVRAFVDLVTAEGGAPYELWSLVFADDDALPNDPWHHSAATWVRDRHAAEIAAALSAVEPER